MYGRRPVTSGSDPPIALVAEAIAGDASRSSAGSGSSAARDSGMSRRMRSMIGRASVSVGSTSRSRSSSGPTAGRASRRNGSSTGSVPVRSRRSVRVVRRIVSGARASAADSSSRSSAIAVIVPAASRMPEPSSARR